jgi:hypothetical protein
MNSEGRLHIQPRQALAMALLFVAGGPLALWLGLRVRIPEPDPGADWSVATLVVSPEARPEALTFIDIRS